MPLSMQRNGNEWSLEDFDLCKELYRGKASILYKARTRLPQAAMHVFFIVIFLRRRSIDDQD
jgi:hypothetical protein